MMPELNTIQEYWDDLEARVLSPDSSEQVRDLVRSVFYAGAGILANLILKRLQRGEPLTEVVQELRDLIKEHNAKTGTESTDEARAN